MTYQIQNGDCIEVMKSMPDNSIDSIVTDPPYELGFMGKSWDSTGIAFNVEVWKEALRILKPGGHLLAFSGSRTYHRMAVAIEDAGFEIRDQIMWVYGSGFPKSLDISKAIDKVNGEPNRLLKFTTWMRTTGLKAKELDAITQTNMGGHYLTLASQPAIPTVALWQMIRPHIQIEIPNWVDELVQRIEAEREVIGTKPSSLGGTVAAGERNQEIIDYHKNKIVDITAPATDAAKQWQGWGTALKPAHEPIVMARKPLIGTVAANVLEYGTGGLNIEGGRVNPGEKVQGGGNGKASKGSSWGGDSDGSITRDKVEPHFAGRFPANLIHDGSDEVVELFGEAQRFFYCAKTSKRDRNEGLDGFEVKEKRYMATANGTGETSKGMDRFTTLPVANHHPTVKPTDLMRYLCRLVTPPNGVILDPFMGSGSTGKGAIYEDFNFIGIEMEAEYVAIAKARIDYAVADKAKRLL